MTEKCTAPRPDFGRRIVWAALTMLALVAAPAAAQQSSPLTDQQAAAVKALVLQTLRENPEIIGEALQALQARAQADAEAQAQQAVKAQEADLFSDPDAPVIGNSDGDVTVVEFFDYNCPYCKKTAPELKMLIAKDPMIRVVMREWPILGPDSVYAARASLAARAQGKYAEFHDALMGMPRANPATVRRVATELGLDLDRLTADMQDPTVTAHIDKSNALTSSLGINGTPGFVIGETIIRGYSSYDDLAAVVVETRARTKAAATAGASDE